MRSVIVMLYSKAMDAVAFHRILNRIRDGSAHVMDSEPNIQVRPVLLITHWAPNP